MWCQSRSQGRSGHVMVKGVYLDVFYQSGSKRTGWTTWMLAGLNCFWTEMTKLSVELPSLHRSAMWCLTPDHWTCSVHHSSVPLTAPFTSMPEVGDFRRAGVTCVISSSHSTACQHQYHICCLSQWLGPCCSVQSDMQLHLRITFGLRFSGVQDQRTLLLHSQGTFFQLSFTSSVD